MYLLENTAEAQAIRAHVCELLASSAQENVELACQLIAGGGMHPQFILPAWAAFYAFEEEALQTRLQGQILAVAPYLADSKGFETHILYAPVQGILAAQQALEAAYPQDCHVRAFIEMLYPLLASDQHYFDRFYQRAPDKGAFLLACKIEENALNLSHSRLQSLPAEIGEFPHLERIDITYSNITHLPESFFSLEALAYFHHHGTKLEKNNALQEKIKQRLPLIEATSLFQEAYGLYHKAHYSRAVLKMKQTLALCPQNVTFWHWYGEMNRMANMQEAGKV